MTTRRSIHAVALLLVTLTATAAQAQKSASYPPIADYLMPRDAEIALARSAAPPCRRVSSGSRAA